MLSRLWLILCFIAVAGVASHAQAGSTDGFITSVSTPPPGFDVLAQPQTTQADVYYGGRFLLSTFVEFTPTGLSIQDTQAIAAAIPNLRNPPEVAAALRGQLATNAERLCSARRRKDCGVLAPEVAGVIFDEARFRVDVFVDPSQLLVHRIEVERYLPAPGTDRSLLHNLRLHMAGVGDDHRYSIASDSYIASRQSRLQARYALNDTGPALYEMSWQRDEKDHEFEIGSFRTLTRMTAFMGEVGLIGARVATSTKTRLDLDTATATPIFLFLPQRSRVDIYRGQELLDSRYYDAGNQQIDTAEFPDGAYDITLRTVEPSGFEREQQQFFVRSNLMPPLGEPQAFVEAGSVADPLHPDAPRASDSAWLRGGMSKRLSEAVAMDHELIYANGTSVLQSGAMFFTPRWHVQGGLMYSSDNDTGVSVRGGYRVGQVGLSFDLRQVNAADRVRPIDEFALVRGDSTQAFATLSFPLARGQAFLRGRLNKRDGYDDSGIGFSYWGSLFNRGGRALDFTFDSHFGSHQRWIRLGLNYRWRMGNDYASLRPELQFTEDEYGDRSTDLLVDGRWSNPGRFPGFGRVDQSYFFTHDPARSTFGGRFVPREFQQSEIELGLQRDDRNTDMYYAMSNRFSIATANGRTTVGDGGNRVGAIVVEITGNTFGQFEVLVDDRVVGYAWANRPNVISLRPYETYDVRIRPLGDRLVGFDEASQQITLYPGTVHTISFGARAINVLIGELRTVDGRALSHGRFENVEGYGATDGNGWFQVEVGHNDALVVQKNDGGRCRAEVPDFETQDGLAIVDTLICEPIPEQP